MENFEKILEVWQRKRQTSLLVCAAMFLAGIILLLTRHMVGWLLVCGGIVILGLLYYNKAHLEEQLDRIEDKEAFLRQFDSKDTLKFENLGFALTPDYIIMTLPYLQIYPLREMKKFEVGSKGETRRALFITDGNGRRHKLAEADFAETDNKDKAKLEECRQEFAEAHREMRRIFGEREI